MALPLTTVRKNPRHRRNKLKMQILGDFAKSRLSRRRFVGNAAALTATAFLPVRIFGDASSAARVNVRLDDEIGTVRPEFHSHFAEHLGSCVYGGLWVGKNSPIANINGYRKQAVRSEERRVGKECRSRWS